MSGYGRILPGGDYYAHVMSRIVNRVGVGSVHRRGGSVRAGAEAQGP